MLVAALFACAAPAHGEATVAVEYRHRDWGHHFLTALPDEIAQLDHVERSGGDWERTGALFNVWTAAAADRVATCRFFGTGFAPKSSHFYTPLTDECEATRNDRSWLYEGIAFYVALPDANGRCPTGTNPLYRMYNNGMGGAPNHRHTTSPDVVQRMEAVGWSLEGGHATTRVFACVEGGDNVSTVAGHWSAKSSRGEDFWLFLEGNYNWGKFTIYSTDPVYEYWRAVVVDTGYFTVQGGQLASVATGRPGEWAMRGRYTWRGTMEVTMGPVNDSRDVTATYRLSSDSSTIAGRYVQTSPRAWMDVRDNGTFNGGMDGCTVAGLLRQTDPGHYRWTMDVVEGGCPLGESWVWEAGAGSFGGVMFYAEAKRRILLLDSTGAAKLFFFARQ